MSPDPNGVVVIDKPPGMTSQRVVSRVKRVLGVKKAGHAGTLDPMATGVLIVGIGRATRLLGFLMGHDKSYSARIRLGMATTTDDAEGQEIGRPTSTRSVTPDQIDAAIATLTGDIEQTPSQFSAVKIDGRRAYALAREGAEVQLKPRQVKVSRFQVIDRKVHGPFTDLDVEVDCSPGTYIRALARDLGTRLTDEDGRTIGGHLTRLRRTRSGSFDVENAVRMDDLDSAGPAAALSIIPMAQVARNNFCWLDVDDRTAANIRFGRAIDLTVPDNPTALLHGEEFLALYEPAVDSGSKPVAVFV
jgi:tRNA pseudouridine55 synthase